MPPDELHKLPDWRDDTIYQWTFRHTRRQFSRVLGYLLAACVFFPAAICGFFWCVSLVWPGGAFWLSLVATSFFLFLTAYTLGRLGFGRRERQHEAAGRTAPVAIFAMSALAYVLAAPGHFVHDDFRNTGGAGVGQWVLFWFDNTLSVVLLDIPQVFHVQFSPITPGGTVSRLATVVLRVLVAAGVIEGVLRCYRSTFHDERFHGTMEECYWKCEGLSGAEQVEVVLEGRVQRLPERRSVNAARVIDTFRERARQPG